MKIDVLTLFPEMFSGVLDTSMLGRAREKGILDVSLHNIREYSQSKHKNTDDYPFGGGAGMVMMPQPIFSCLDAVDPRHEALRIVFTPRGATLSVPMAQEFAGKERLLLLCGRRLPLPLPDDVHSSASCGCIEFRWWWGLLVLRDLDNDFAAGTQRRSLWLC